MARLHNWNQLQLGISLILSPVVYLCGSNERKSILNKAIFFPL